MVGEEIGAEGARKPGELHLARTTATPPPPPPPPPPPQTLCHELPRCERHQVVARKSCFRPQPVPRDTRPVAVDGHHLMCFDRAIWHNAALLVAGAVRRPDKCAAHPKRSRWFDLNARLLILLRYCGSRIRTQHMMIHIFYNYTPWCVCHTRGQILSTSTNSSQVFKIQDFQGQGEVTKTFHQTS